MANNLGPISNPQIFVLPSQELSSYIRKIKIGENMPLGIQNIVYKNKLKEAKIQKILNPEYLTTEDEKLFIKSLNLDSKRKWHCISKDFSLELKSPKNNKNLLSLQDLHWLYTYLQNENINKDTKVYLHELMKGSEIILPQNEVIPRNEELEKRCQRLKAEQQNREYQNMTKNVDNVRKMLPEDTIGYQVKMINTHLIAVFQFIVSVITGFVFGFIGIDLLLGTLDFGMRLLLGIICALTVAIAELYFLAKKLNEELEFEVNATKKETKVD